ncbi:MAG: alkaline phosphatase family protein [Archaeoglobus sp.]|uniref:alkaline phosphatase family protein n=1 Tax=Archaeoglobus sp. TaxID=1872626 RepID=UPI001D3A52D2|nr:alkaline phosphatase family protein [Archaeoglobus sp.]MBO8180930.1 alkaline phosphatase family protein [Archaeoglobus sp.]
MTKEIKVLVIGLDGATWDLIRPWVEEGKLSTFKKLMESGVWGKLESTIPPWTIPAWESMSTGKSPKKLGFATFMVKDGYRFVPHIFKHKRQRMVWDVISDAGHNVVVVNLPNVYVAQKINGCMVAGWLCLDKNRISYPPDLIDELNECCNGYEIDIFDVDFERGRITSGPRENEYLKRCEKLLEKHFLAFMYLLEKYEWDFGFIVFVTTDRIQHKYWDGEILLEHYKKIDKKLENLIGVTGNETIVFLVSDHGFGPRQFQFNVNEWLIKEGYLKLKQSQYEHKWLSLVKFLKKTGLIILARKILNVLPSNVSKSIKKKVSLIKFEDLDIDWSNTKAFAYGVFGDIWLNVKGREPAGVLDQKEYDKIRDEIIQKLKDLKPNVQVFKKEEVYSEARIDDNLPDLLILPTNDGIQTITPNVGYGSIFTKTDGGDHRLNGIFLAYGPGIKKGQRIDAKIYDIAPTILHIFGLPIPNDMDGGVLTEIFEEDSEFAKRKPEYVDPSYYEEKREGEKLKKAIKNLKLKGKI